MERRYLKKNKYYDRVIEKNENDINFSRVIAKMKDQYDKSNSMEKKVIFSSCIRVIAPTLVSYVLYILKDCEERGIKRVYFLSRDGYIMLKIAEIICREFNLDIECRYLYVSRLTLKAPMYIFDKTEALDYICSESRMVTLRGIFNRTNINEKSIEKIIRQIDFDEDMDKPLKKEQLIYIKNKLEKNKLFHEEMYKTSLESYNSIGKYFYQEGLMEKVNYAFVDTGWMGSMQRHIRQILSGYGINNKVIGYYFGMFREGKIEDGEYNCFYFSKDKNYFRRSLFNNNVFECMCSANHGMTIGYEENERGIIPKLKEYKENWDVSYQLKVIVQFAEIFVKENDWNNMNINGVDILIKKLLIGFMIFPEYYEAKVYGNIPFCDDSTEGYMISLAETCTKNELKKHNVFIKSFYKFAKRKNKKDEKIIFWVNGSIQVSDIKNKKMKNLNCILLEILHCVKLKMNM